jgi:hypothetical protein
MIHFNWVARNVLWIPARRWFMNNLTLSLSGADLSRLRTLVAAVDKEIVHDSGSSTAAGSQTPKSALNTTWSRLVEMLDLGTEPEMRTCPTCKHLCTLGTTRCSHCWTSLLPLIPKERVAA